MFLIHRQKTSRMYGLPKTIDLSFLSGRTLCQICIGEFQVQFNFDARVRIHVENPFTYVDANGMTEHVKTAPSSAGVVSNLIGKVTSEITPSDNGTLEVKFSTGEKLILYDDNPAYECYTIRRGDQTIAV